MKTGLWALLFAFVLSLIFCLCLIPALRKWKTGQNILSYVKEHKKKGGTPTMGGVAFIAAATFAAAVFMGKAEKIVIVSMAIGLSFMAVGLLDDFLKCKRKKNLGLRAWQKFAFQACIALFAAIFCYRQGVTQLYIPFTQRALDVGWGILPIAVFVFLATVNAVNLTDGLDGLASGVSIPFFAFLGGILLLQGQNQTLPVLCFSLVGALVAYLFFNVSPASVFMGDTGSLALGGFASCIACFSGNALYIAVIGFMFVLSVISVLVQVIYYKATGGKRVFLMAPIHHHFQQKGYSESKISFAYAAITFLLGAFCVVMLL